MCDQEMSKETLWKKYVQEMAKNRELQDKIKELEEVYSQEIMKNSMLENKIKELEAQPRLPVPNENNTCKTTHHACDCVLKRLAELETELKEKDK